MNLESLVKFGVEQGASTIHLQAGSPPQLRINGLIRNVEGAALKVDDIRTFLATIVPVPPTDSITGGASFSAALGQIGRFGVTTYGHAGGLGVTLRVIPPAPRSIDDLHLPEVVRRVALAGRGLTLIVGPTGSGRSTTLAAMIDAVNQAAYRKIVSLEAPVEALHVMKKSLIAQIEVGRDVSTFEKGIELARRQDAELIAVGDLRDAPTARAALAAAEAGHQVLAVMTVPFVIPALTRLISLFPPQEKETVVAQLGASFEAAVAQRLARTRDGKLRPALEILRAGPNILKAIQEGRPSDLAFYIEGQQAGMQSLDQHLVSLQHAGIISGTETMRLASSPEAVAEKLRILKQTVTVAESPDGGLQPLN